MGAKQTGDALCQTAIKVLRGWGFQCEATMSTSSSQIFDVSHSGRTERVLIQSRDLNDERNNDPNKFVVGVLVKALDQVDRFVIWFATEEKFLSVSASRLQELHLELRNRGIDLGYTGKGNHQWRVNVFLDRSLLIPQNSKQKLELDNYPSPPP